MEQVSNGVQGHNSESINVCYIGGIDKAGKPTDTSSKEQKEALITLLTKLKKIILKQRF